MFLSYVGEIRLIPDSWPEVGSQVDRLFEGDPFPFSSFNGLVDMDKEEELGEDGASNLIPEGDGYPIVMTDPRPESDAFREIVLSLQSLPVDMRRSLLLVNADALGPPFL